jgi:hypothetical protein
MRFSLILTLASASLAVFACSESGTLAITDAPVDAGPDATLACAPSGVSKGPWVLGANLTGAKIRWEACRAGVAGGLTLTPEAGGAAQKATSSETAFTTAETYTAPLQPMATPDYAGVFYMHEAALTGLLPSTCYRYALDADAAATGRFCTARNPGDPLRFMAIGDTNPGLGDSAKNVLAHALPRNPDFTIHGGDLQYYASGLETWASWFPVMQPMLSQGAFFASIGNHEFEKPDEHAQYDQRFFGGAGFDGKDDHYRFQSGGVWFFTVSTELPVIPGSEQALWLEAQLADASQQPGYRFSVAYFHRPFVTCGDTADNPEARAYFEPIFAKYKLLLIVQAHMHGYERFELGAFTYVTAAGGGGSIGRVDENIARAECSSRKASGPFYHAVIFDVTAGKLTGTVIDDKGAVRDSFEKVVP